MYKRVVTFVMVGLFILSLGSFALAADSPLMGSEDEVYYMVTFLSGADFWKGCYLGMQEAAELYGVKTVYAGAPEYDITKAVTVFEQVVAQKPTGIALTCMNPEPFIEPINKAIEQGIKVVTFDTDSPDSMAPTFVSTDNVDAGRVAARYLASAMGEKGKVAVVVRPAQLNVWVRYLGFKEEIEAKFPDMEIVQVIEGQGDETQAASDVAAMLQAKPDINAIFVTSGIEAIGAATAVREAEKDIRILAFDTPAALLDLISDGEVWATAVQNTYLMGYFAMVSLYHLQHNLPNPLTDWQENPNAHPLPPFINTGVTFATKDNAQFYNLRDFAPRFK
jgi:ribose transport system substrate-binding protein